MNMDASLPRTFSLLVALALAGSSLTACAGGANTKSTGETANSEAGASGNFDGDWSVEWCDQNHPEWDCGGFDISLVQEGERLCGDFGGQRINLTQIDEGNIVGTVVGNTVILAVKSLRSGRIALVRADLDGHQLRWKDVVTIQRSENDIDLIATQTTLLRDRVIQNQPHSEPRTCKSILGR